MTHLSASPVAVLVRPDPSLLTAWDELCDRAAAGPFARPGWVVPMVDSFGGDLRLAVTRFGGRLSAVAPFVGARRIETPTGWHTPWHEVAAIDDVSRRAVWAVALRSPWLVADHLLADGQDAEVLGGLLAERGFTTETRDRQRPPYIELAGGWESFEAAMTSKRRSDLRRRMRRLCEQGSVSFDVLDGTTDLDAILDEGFAVEASGWKGDVGTAVAADAATDEFYRSIARWARDRGWLRLALLRLDARAIAFDFSIETGGRHYLLKTGFDESLRSFAPGALLRREMIRRSFEAGLATYEFTGDVAPWKREWTGATRLTVRVDAFSPGPSGRLTRSVWWAGRAAKAARARIGALR